MPPKRRKFESTFPAARIKKIMQLDDDVGRVASSVPVVISRAVEIFLHTLLSRSGIYASSRNAKTLTINHLKYCIEQEKQWDFLKELTAKIPNISMETEESVEPQPAKRGRKRNASPKAPAGKRKQRSKSAACVEKEHGEEESGSEVGTPEPRTSHFMSSSMKSAHTSSSSSSTLATETISAQLLPGSGSIEASGLLDQLSSQCSGPHSIPALISASGLQAQEDSTCSDDDYD